MDEVAAASAAGREESRVGSEPPIERARGLLHRVDPYADLDVDNWPFDGAGWYGEHEIFDGLVRALEPELVVEVGSWKGQSTRSLARALAELGGERGVLAIDTWLGALEFWEDHDDEERYHSLNLVNGYPQVFYQFLANVVHCELNQYIVPFPTTSAIGARWLAKNGFAPSLIYVDASHDRPDVDHDIAAYWEVLTPGGVLFGDDCDEHWPSVVSAVEEFAVERELQVAVLDDHYWMAVKPPGPSVAEMVARVQSLVSNRTQGVSAPESSQ